MKRLLIIVIVLSSITLIGTGVYLSTKPVSKEDNKQEETKQEQKPEKDNVEYTDPNTPTKEFPSIKTEDEKITLSNIKVYYSDEVSAFEVEVTSKEDLNELFLLIEFNLGTENIQRTVVLTDIKANTKTKTQVQIGNDLTKATSWSVKKMTKEEAESVIKYSRSIL